MLGEMGARQTIDRQTGILGGQRKRRTDRDRLTDVRGDGSEIDN